MFSCTVDFYTAFAALVFWGFVAFILCLFLITSANYCFGAKSGRGSLVFGDFHWDSSAWCTVSV